MRHDVSELDDFPNDTSLWIKGDLIERSSPSSLSITEFNNALDLQILEKMLTFPLLRDSVPGTWSLEFQQDVNIISDSDLFQTNEGAE